MAGRGRPSRASVYERLDRALGELNQRYGGLPDPREARTIWNDIWHLEAHNSTALEGNTLVLREVQALLDQGRAVGAKPLREYNEVRGYADAAQWVYGQALEPASWHDGQLLTLTEIRHVHRTAMTPAWDVAPHPEATAKEAPGNFREHDIQPFSGGMKPPSWPLVPARVEQWVNDTCAAGERISEGALERPVPEELGRLHNEFERIHPFLDGNGRTGRLLLNLLLVAASRRRRLRCSRGDDRPRDVRQPQSLHRAEHRRPRPVRAAAGAGNPRGESGSAAARSATRASGSLPGARWRLAKLSQGGRGVPSVTAAGWPSSQGDNVRLVARHG